MTDRRREWLANLAVGDRVIEHIPHYGTNPGTVTWASERVVEVGGARGYSRITGEAVVGFARIEEPDDKRNT